MVPSGRTYTFLRTVVFEFDTLFLSSVEFLSQDSRRFLCLAKCSFDAFCSFEAVLTKTTYVQYLDRSIGVYLNLCFRHRLLVRVLPVLPVTVAFAP